ncbi:hypothetical protein [Streptomyces sp. NPDC054765]
MDAGVAALLGAAVGGLLGAGGTIGAAALSGRAQGRSQHSHWRRQGRREVYSRFLEAISAHQEALGHLSSIAYAAIRGDHSPEELNVAWQEASALLPAVRTAGPIVVIEGPRSVAELAEDIVNLATTATSNARSYSLIHARQAYDDSALGQRSRNVNEAVSELKQKLSAFADLARNALDAPDGVHS